MKKLVYLFVSAFVFSLALGAAPVKAAEYNWKLAHEELPGGFMDAIATEFAKRLAEKKNYRQILGYGQVRLIPFWEQYFNARIRPGREGFAFSDHDYVEMVVEGAPPPDALTLESDPMVLLRPEGAWDEAGILDRSAARPATNLGAHAR